ncbi:amino acid permease [Geothrix limicola]|uniref:Amino acid permease n=1 Tax=Geothrix limicola TaxID=2927978 RepID=A0ABQ5QIP3_9BACT|nr:APC family permease [Geothrix limicola]GLH74737.1 amino acid permease [Geothrix limicola]
MTSQPSLRRTLSSIEYFAFGFGSMVGVAWVVLIDDWLARGGPAGGMLAFLLGGLALLPVALTYGRLARVVQDAGAEVAYTEGVFPPSLSYAAGWMMVLAYGIVCPWEAVAIGNLLARALPGMNQIPLYVVGGKTIFLPRLLAGLGLVTFLGALNYRGMQFSSRFQNLATYGMLALFLGFTTLGLFRGEARNLQPLFAHAGPAGTGLAGAGLSILLMLQVMPYFMTGFETVVKGSEEAKEGYDPRGFGRSMVLSLGAGALFYTLVIFVVAWIVPWRDLVAGKFGTEQAFQRAFGSRLLAQVILFAALLSLLKVFNAMFVAATRLVYALGHKGMVHAAMGTVHPRYRTPSAAVLLVAGLTGLASFLGDAALIPIIDVGSLAVTLGWQAASLAALGRLRRAATPDPTGLALAGLSAVVSLALIAMKALPGIPGSFTRTEWTAFGAWVALGALLWTGWRKAR